MGGIVVKPRARIFHGHDWVFSGEVLKVFGTPADGDVISLKDGKDRLIGARFTTANRRSWRGDFRDGNRSSTSIFSSAELAGGGISGPARRELAFVPCVWSESDGLPGVIVDR